MATVRAANGMVATGQPLATAAGLAALREGGSAADAAVAAAAVCAVTLPDATSAAADLFALVYDARTRSVSAYNGSGRAAAALDVGRFGGAYPAHGAELATVPGVVAAWADLVADHGRLGLDRALAPAIAYAADGFPVTARLARGISQVADELATNDDCARTFMPRGRPLAAGEMLQQPELAATLREVARSGAEAFYRGALAEQIGRGMRAMGADMTALDLAAHVTDRPDPLMVDYRGLQIYGQPPVSQGHILLEELALAEGFDLRALSWASPELVHLMVEMKKLGFADRDTYAGDPHVVEFDARRLLESSFVSARRKDLSDRASDGGRAGTLVGHTTYLCTTDRDGNAVSLIESVFDEFGARVIVPGTGLLLNSRMRSFSLDPGSPNSMAGGKRPVHTLNAVLAMQDGAPRFVMGTPGAQAQVQTNFQLLVGLIDFGFDPQHAIDQPRWRHESGRTLEVEGRFPEAARRGLVAKGHKLTVAEDWAPVTGGAQIIAVESNGSFAAGADPRRDGHAAGY